MLDILDEIKSWTKSKDSFALATVTQTWRSAPRGVGASMIVDKEGKMIGSVSGGCVEGQVVKYAREVLAGEDSKTLKFGVSNDEAWSVGLSCGGAISVLVQPFFDKSEPGAKIWQEFQHCLAEDKGCVLIYQGKEVGFYSENIQIGTFSESVFKQASLTLHSRQSQIEQVDSEDLFFHVFPPKNHLLIVGAAHISRDLIALAKQLDFRVSVIDPRGLFYDSLRDLVDEQDLLRKWPADALPAFVLDDSVYAVLLTHDPKIDDQALQLLLPAKVAYIGALGSKKTQQKRVARLLEAGFSPTEIDRIHGPVGLDIGAASPAEIALSIMAEIIKVKNQAVDD